jgi:homocysteine S-methyltransferase
MSLRKQMRIIGVLHMNIKDYLKSNILITDGAMGTYYSEITGNNVSYCELANIKEPNVIMDIHKEYINAGAKLLRTNTFSANSITMGLDKAEIKKIIQSGYNIAKEAAQNEDIFVGASIGPIREEQVEDKYVDILEEYTFIVDTFLELGQDIFIFETFSNTDYLEKISAYIKDRNKDAFILTQFAVMPDGYTRSGISVSRIVDEVENIKNIDGYGFNCGSGPTHFVEIIKKLNIEGKIISALPNAGYPDLINERTIYSNSPSYFADKIIEIKALGASIIGGCCGTNPNHIRRVCEKLTSISSIKLQKLDSKVSIPKKLEISKIKNNFAKKLDNKEFVVAVELSAPSDTDISKIMECAKLCKDNNIDLVTIPDSPMSKVKADSFIIASKIKREIGIDAMPHICCRDKNINAIRSSLIGAHIENVRNILAITGDPVSDASKVETKSVFNLNSFKLINLIDGMNKEVFVHDNIQIGGALNLNVRNKEMELDRMLKKMEKGAKFFLTQPIYEDSAIEYLLYIKLKYNVKILGGILPVVTYRNAQFLNNELAGVNIPEKYMNMFKEDMTKEEAENVGINIATDLGRRMKPYVDGFYIITPFNRVGMIIKILKEIDK